MKQVILSLAILFLSSVIYADASAQSNTPVLPSNASLKNCIRYALNHQPALQQSYLDQQITEHSIKSKLSDWYPHAGLNYSLNHYFKQPTSLLTNNATGTRQPVKTGVINNSVLGLSVDQTIFNSDVFLAARSAKTVRKQAAENVTDAKINTIVGVTKAYYDVLISQRQLDILKQDIKRLRKSLHDAYSQYKAGLADETDYERATISLNNSLAELKSTQEQVQSNYASLKQLMGYPLNQPFAIRYDTTQMDENVHLDTTQVVNYNNRIEYQLLQSQKKLQRDNLEYYRLNFLPSLSIFYDYNLAYLNDTFPKLYNSSYPNALVGLTLSLPLFQGTKRLQNVKVAKLEVERTNWEITALKFQINTEFVHALATYKSNFNDWQILKKNVEMARKVYHTISLQYNSGVKTYLDVITAESDLRDSEFNYLNALFNVLSSKVDVEKAMGEIQLNQ